MAFLFCITSALGYIFLLRDFRRTEYNNRLLRYHSTLLKNISDAIITTDINRMITDWNLYAEELYGYTAAEVNGKNIYDVLKLQFTGNEGDTVSALLHDGKTWKGELIHHHRSGRPIWVQISSSALREEKGEISGTISVIRDVSERISMDAELKKLTNNLQQQVSLKSNELNHVFERITDAFIALDNDWNYTYLNKAALELHGNEETELIGKNLWELFPDLVNETFYTALHEAKVSQQPQRRELYYSKEDAWYEDLIYPGKDGISVYYRDVTKKRKAQEKLEASEEALKFSNERLELVGKATNDAIWDWDMRTDSITGNESFYRLFHIETGSALSYAAFLEKVHPEDNQKLKENFHAAFEEKKTLITEEFRLITGSGEYKLLYARAHILYDPGNSEYRMLGAMQDITELKQTEQKLLIEKDLSDSIINSLPGIFYLYNRKGEFYRWNRNFETVTGYNESEIKELHPLNLFLPEDQSLLKEKIRNVFHSGSDNVEALFLTKSGKTIPYYFTGMLINYENEDCLMGVGLDISEKIKSQQELIESEEKFRTLVQQASDGIVITDSSGNFLDVNQSFSLITGYTREELLVKTVYEIFPDQYRPGKAFRYNEMSRGMVVLTERQVKTKNEEYVDVEISGKQLEDGRFQGIIRDISERKTAEEALRISEKKYRLLFNDNPLPMWILSLPGKRFIDVNSAAIQSYGYSKKEFLQMSVNDINPGIAADHIYSSLKQERVWDHIKRSGEIIKVNIIANNIIYEGSPAVLVLANDITDKFLAEENLQRSHEELRELASHLETIREAERTHMAREIHDELGQQLTGLKMDITWLGRKIQTEDEVIKTKLKETVELIDKTVITVRRIATELRPSILDDLGLVAAMEWQTEEFEKRSDIKASFISNVSNINVTPEIATGIFRIFQESLTNVLRHSRATAVRSSFRAENDMLRLKIEDNGIGFRRSEIENKKTLGLLGMKERASLIKGNYEINGETGKGTSVIITVPLKGFI